MGRATRIDTHVNTSLVGEYSTDIRPDFLMCAIDDSTQRVPAEPAELGIG